jgi:hypothetical protein
MLMGCKCVKDQAEQLGANLNNVLGTRYVETAAAGAAYVKSAVDCLIVVSKHLVADSVDTKAAVEIACGKLVAARTYYLCIDETVGHREGYSNDDLAKRDALKPFASRLEGAAQNLAEQAGAFVEETSEANIAAFKTARTYLSTETEAFFKELGPYIAAAPAEHAPATTTAALTDESVLAAAAFGGAAAGATATTELANDDGEEKNDQLAATAVARPPAKVTSGAFLQLAPYESTKKDVTAAPPRLCEAAQATMAAAMTRARTLRDVLRASAACDAAGSEPLAIGEELAQGNVSVAFPYETFAELRHTHVACPATLLALLRALLDGVDFLGTQHLSEFQMKGELKRSGPGAEPEPAATRCHCHGRLAQPGPEDAHCAVCLAQGHLHCLGGSGGLCDHYRGSGALHRAFVERSPRGCVYGRLYANLCGPGLETLRV